MAGYREGYLKIFKQLQKLINVPKKAINYIKYILSIIDTTLIIEIETFCRNISFQYIIYKYMCCGIISTGCETVQITFAASN